MRFYEKIERSLIKAITFRFLVLSVDFIIIYTITGRYDTTLRLVLIANIFHTLLYFLHERFWDRVHFGKTHKKKI
ncbi:hypothetical protein A2773_03675 [Candidatus Gottesmanbacteria bacterium RIFCSPHIGHO2_01_FULL_39_10]|uniref:DUF2061 domain-containing protein n=1 Tax=Candidatus Gottesmanbacteria bacterium RIFCSPHIGHO2_01_FULL_39_10 TaxID=1798375 RepID=A0A1F5ZRY8_9BACT|nr:MAG: hypothetical protein A2773_03675 [Candidatus Gottesmanbacteria bacterium RIFCSPHIGHO2_01_FULL_39_10]